MLTIRDQHRRWFRPKRGIMKSITEQIRAIKELQGQMAVQAQNDGIADSREYKKVFAQMNDIAIQLAQINLHGVGEEAEDFWMGKPEAGSPEAIRRERSI